MTHLDLPILHNSNDVWAATDIGGVGWEVRDGGLNPDQSGVFSLVKLFGCPPLKRLIQSQKF